MANLLRVTNSSTAPEGTAPVVAPASSSDPTPAIRFNLEEQAYHKYITLERNRMIRDIKLTIRKPAEKSTVSGWERKNGVPLPPDLKDYYLSTNGFKLTWSLEHAGDNLKIGEMNINQVSKLLPLESMDSLMESSSVRKTAEPTNKSNYDYLKLPRKQREQHVEGQESQPSSGKVLGGGPSSVLDEPYEGVHFSIHFSDLRRTMEASGQLDPKDDPQQRTLSSKDKAFILDQNKYGWVCLFYPQRSQSGDNVEQKHEILFLDNSLHWYFLAPTFSHYYRMLLFHLGLPQWQYRFTPYGLSSWAEQIFWLVAPHLLEPPKALTSDSSVGLWSSDVPPEAANVNPTPNLLSHQIFKRKKKEKGEK